jgi:hypothetical protein
MPVPRLWTAERGSVWRLPSINSDRASLTMGPWSGSGWSRRLRRNKAYPSNSWTGRCNTPCYFFNVWRIRANASRREAAGSSAARSAPRTIEQRRSIDKCLHADPSLRVLADSKADPSSFSTSQYPLCMERPHGGRSASSAARPTGRNCALFPLGSRVARLRGPTLRDK